MALFPGPDDALRHVLDPLGISDGCAAVFLNISTNLPNDVTIRSLYRRERRDRRDKTLTVAFSILTVFLCGLRVSAVKKLLLFQKMVHQLVPFLEHQRFLPVRDPLVVGHRSALPLVPAVVEHERDRLRRMGPDLERRGWSGSARIRYSSNCFIPCMMFPTMNSSKSSMALTLFFTSPVCPASSAPPRGGTRNPSS